MPRSWLCGQRQRFMPWPKSWKQEIASDLAQRGSQHCSLWLWISLQLTNRVPNWIELVPPRVEGLVLSNFTSIRPEPLSPVGVFCLQQVTRHILLSPLAVTFISSWVECRTRPGLAVTVCLRKIPVLRRRLDQWLAVSPGGCLQEIQKQRQNSVTPCYSEAGESGGRSLLYLLGETEKKSACC